MIITESICTGNRRYKAYQIFNPIGVVLHSIGTPQPDASALRNYWQRDASPYVVHYMVDDTKILHCMPDNLLCWHVGGPGNSQFLGIEMGEPAQIQYTGGASFTVSDLPAAQAYTRATYNNAVWLIAKLCIENGWDPFAAVWTHYEITKRHMSNTDHVDPQHLWNGLSMPFDLGQLRRDVASNMAVINVTPPAPANPTGPDVEQLYRIRKSWEDAASQIGAYSNLGYAVAACEDGYAVFDADGKQVYPFTNYVVRITATALNVRSGPGTDFGVVMTLEHGGAYTIVDEADGWGRLKSGAGWICLKYTERV